MLHVCVRYVKFAQGDPFLHGAINQEQNKHVLEGLYERVLRSLRRRWEACDTTEGNHFQQLNEVSKQQVFTSRKEGTSWRLFTRSFSILKVSRTRPESLVIYFGYTLYTGSVRVAPCFINIKVAETLLHCSPKWELQRLGSVLWPNGDERIKIVNVEEYD